MADDSENGYLNIKEFKSMLNYLNLYTLDDSEIVDVYLDMDKKADGELIFEDIFKYLRSIIIIEGDLNPAKLRLFDAMLTADHMNQCQLGGITQLLNKTWANFSQYRRYGHNDQLVVSSGDNIAVVREGTYSLLDLIHWSDDRLAEIIEPRHAVIKGVRIHESNCTGKTESRIEISRPIIQCTEMIIALYIHYSSRRNICKS